MANSVLIKSSIAKKWWMALTGLFLCTFLVGHLAGNLQLLISDPTHAAESFNAYAQFMTTNPLVKILSYVTYFSILFHAIDGIMLVMANRAARPQRYAHERASTSSVWASRNMGILGTAMLAFIIIHMSDFWFEMHFEMKPTFKLDNGNEVKDLYLEVVEAFHSFPYMLLYVLCMIPIGFHLYHGFQSAFRTLGLIHENLTLLVKRVGVVFSIVVPMAFAIIPLYVYHFIPSAEEIQKMDSYKAKSTLIEVEND
jgi:succinate dehydrogenase / fumarate reductase cytochrome b subunit